MQNIKKKTKTIISLLLCFAGLYMMPLVGFPPFKIRQPYLNDIKAGYKTVEGRINRGRFSQLRPGDKVKFYDAENPHDYIICTITGIQVYPTFFEMLRSEGLQKMIPDVTSLEEGIAIYESFPGYRENVEKYGALALRLKIEYIRLD